MKGEYMPLWRLREIIGADGTRKLIDARGGTEMYVPAKLKPSSLIVRLIGMDLAQRLSAAITTFGTGRAEGGGDMISLPKPDLRRLDNLQYVEAHPEMSEPELARALNVHGRTVRRLRAIIREQAA